MQYDSELKHAVRAYRNQNLQLHNEPTINVGQCSLATMQAAIANGWEEIFKYGTLEDIAPILETSPDIVNWKNVDGMTPLHLVCWTNDDPDAIFFIAKKTKKRNVKDNRGLIPYDYLSRNKWFTIVPDHYNNARWDRLMRLDVEKIIVNELGSK